MGGIARPVPSDDRILHSLKYITKGQQEAAVKQQNDEVKQGKKERNIGEILKEQTSKSEHPVTQKELDIANQVRRQMWKDAENDKFSPGDPNPKKIDFGEKTIKSTAKALNIPEGKAVEPAEKPGSDKRAEAGRAWDPEHLLTEATKPGRGSSPLVERIDPQA